MQLLCALRSRFVWVSINKSVLLKLRSTGVDVLSKGLYSVVVLYMECFRDASK